MPVFAIYFWSTGIQYQFYSRLFHILWRVWRLITDLLNNLLNIGFFIFSLFTFVGLFIFEKTEKNWQAKEEINVVFMDRYGDFIGQRGQIHTDDVFIKEIPDYLIKAVLATEDRHFFQHWGIDLRGIFRAMIHNMQAHGSMQGGSTLTQQLAKNLFLTNKRTLNRKIREVYLALWLEANLSKQEILQLYLEKTYMGGGNFGISAASRFYFSKNIQSISLAEAAMLAGLLKAPARYAPHVNLLAARARANIVLNNLVKNKMMTESQVANARQKPAAVYSQNQHSCSDYFLDWAFKEIRKIPSLKSESSFIIRTTFDQYLQQVAEEAVEFYLKNYGMKYNVTQAAVVILDNNGSVRAIVGGRSYHKSSFNRATQAIRQPGSSFKPYVYAAALEKGLTPKTVVIDAPISWNGWKPRNYSRNYVGRVNLETALAKSLNTVAVRLAYYYLHRSTNKIVNLAKAMGIETPLVNHKTIVLGTSGITVLDQATGFNVFANDGLVGNRHAFTQIYAKNGKLLWDWSKNAPQLQRVLSKKVARNMNTMLVQVPVHGTAHRAALPMTRVAGKTGTTQSYRDAWFVGYTGNYTAAVWVGNDDFSPMQQLTGGTIPTMIWHRIMFYAHQNVTIKDIPGIKNNKKNSFQDTYY